MFVVGQLDFTVVCRLVYDSVCRDGSCLDPFLLVDRKQHCHNDQASGWQVPKSAKKSLASTADDNLGNQRGEFKTSLPNSTIQATI